MPDLVLASGSAIRQAMLAQVGLNVLVDPARIDEAAIRQSLEAEDAAPRDIADALAEFKARRVAERHPDVIVLGCDQVLAFEGVIYSKPETEDAAYAQLRALSGQRHMLLSAVVAYKAGEPIWRTVGVVRLHMRPLSEEFITAYVARNWPGLKDTVGGYKLEEEGAALFTRVDGDFFTVLGLPLLDVCGFLRSQGVLKS